MEEDPGERKGKAELTESTAALEEALETEKISSDVGLANSLARFSQMYFAPPDNMSDFDSLEAVFNESRKSRVYIISQLVDWLYKENRPQSLIEVGSAGDVTAAMALPQTEVASVDIDPDIFLNVPNNSLPREFFNKLGMKKTMVGYGRDNLWKGKRKKLALVEKSLPNWHMSINDAKDLLFPDDSYDVALAQGPLEINFYIKEMARVTKPGGYVVIIMYEEEKDVNSNSVYETGIYNSYPDIRMVDLEEANSLGLEQVDIPDRLKNYENLANWKKGEIVRSAGVVFQVFKKNEISDKLTQDKE